MYFAWYPRKEPCTDPVYRVGKRVSRPARGMARKIAHAGISVLGRGSVPAILRSGSFAGAKPGGVLLVELRVAYVAVPASII